MPLPSYICALAGWWQQRRATAVENTISKVLSVPALLPKALPTTKIADGNGGDDTSRLLTPRADH